MQYIPNAKDQNIIENIQPYGDISEKYIATSTEAIITEMNKHRGLVPIDFKAANVRKEEKEGKQKHVTILQGDNSELIDGTNLRIVLFNSTDRSSAIKIYIGAYRAVCANGMVFGDDIMEPVSIRHTKKDWKYSIFQLMQHYDDIQRSTQDMIHRMQDTNLTYNSIGQLTEMVADQFSNEITGQILDHTQFNQAHREEDVGKNAWLTYQRIQYNLMQGGIDRVIEKRDEEDQLFKTISKTHKITDHAKQIQFNTKLHKMIMGII